MSELQYVTPPHQDYIPYEEFLVVRNDHEILEQLLHLLDYRWKESGSKPRDSFSNFNAAGSLLGDLRIEDMVCFFQPMCVCVSADITEPPAVISQRCSADAVDPALLTGTHTQLGIGSNYQVGLAVSSAG